MIGRNYRPFGKMLKWEFRLTLQTDFHQMTVELLEECHAQIKSQNSSILKCVFRLGWNSQQWCVSSRSQLHRELIEDKIWSSSLRPPPNTKQTQFDQGLPISNLKF
jgi:hypothetical protein